MDEYTIEFSDPNDVRTGFLCNDSNHGFNLSGKWWPSVEHYMSAMMFEGTQYEDEIRLAPTVAKVRHLVKPRRILEEEDGRMVYVTVYGKNSNYKCKDDWDEPSQKSHLEQAIKAKFTNERLLQRLKKTGSAILVGTSKITGSILHKIREGGTTLPPDDKDIVGETSLTQQELAVIDSLMALTRRVAEVEGCDTVHHEMIEDAIYSACGLQTVSYIESLYRDKKWSDIRTNTPKLALIVDTVRDIVGDIKMAAWVAGLIKLLRSTKTAQRTNITKRLASHEDIDIQLLQKERLYRLKPDHKPAPDVREVIKHSIKQMELKDITVEEVMSRNKDLLRRSKKDDFIRIVEEEIEAVRALGTPAVPDIDPIAPTPKRKLIKNLTQEGLTLYKENNKLVVTGDGLKRHSTKLLSLGGQYVNRKFTQQNTDVIKFEGEALETHSERLLTLGATLKKDRLIVKGAPLEQNRSALIHMGGKYPTKTEHITDTTCITFPMSRVDDVVESFRDRQTAQSNHKVIELILDTADCLVKHNRRAIITGDDVYTVVKDVFMLPVSVVRRGVEQEIKTVATDRKYKLDRDAIHVLSQYVDSKLPSGRKFPRLEHLTNGESIFVLALQNIANLSSNKSESARYVHAFTTIAPRKLRKSADQFMSSVMTGLPSSSIGTDEGEAHLKAKGVVCKLSKVIDTDVMEVKTLVVIAAALHFFSPTVRKGDYTALLDRAMMMVGDTSSLDTDSESTEPPKKVEAKAEPPKKVEAKAEPAKKAEAKAEPPKKVEAKAEPAKKVEVKAEPPKKVEVKAEFDDEYQEGIPRMVSRRRAPEKAEVKTEAPKKAEVKTEAPKKVDPPKVEPAKKAEVKAEPPKTDPPKALYSERNMMTSMMRGVVYMKVLSSLKLSDEDYSLCVAQLEKCDAVTRLRKVNEMVRMNNVEKKTLLGLV